MLESGVSAYISCEATVRVFFPVDLKGNPDVSCRQCQFYRKGYSKCGLNDMIVEYPEKYVGSHCPLKEVANDIKF